MKKFERGDKVKTDQGIIGAIYEFDDDIAHIESFRDENGETIQSLTTSHVSRLKLIKYTEDDLKGVTCPECGSKLDYTGYEGEKKFVHCNKSGCCCFPDKDSAHEAISITLKWINAIKKAMG